MQCNAMQFSAIQINTLSRIRNNDFAKEGRTEVYLHLVQFFQHLSDTCENQVCFALWWKGAKCIVCNEATIKPKQDEKHEPNARWWKKRVRISKSQENQISSPLPYLWEKSKHNLPWTLSTALFAQLWCNDPSWWHRTRSLAAWEGRGGWGGGEWSGGEDEYFSYVWLSAQTR